MPDTQTLFFTLAQDGAAPPTEGTAIPGANSGGAPNAPRGGGGFDSLMWMLILVVGFMIVMSMMGSRREKRRREALLSAVKRHDRVQTIGGVIGSVVEVKPNTVVLKVDESSNTRITFARSAIQQILEPAAEPADSGASEPGRS
jgi:preprotein translocase subunit YajC